MSLTVPAMTVFWVCALVVVYLYLGYPALLLALSRLRPRPVRRGGPLPSVAIVVPVHNEQAVLRDKIDNCLALDYPAQSLEVLVVSDGSTDASEAIVRDHSDPRVRLLALPRCGKAAALDAGAAHARGEVLVFTDADAVLEPASLRRLAEPFADGEVGGVCGNKRQRLGAGDATGSGEGLYWRYDQWQKRLESAVGSVFAADGSLYAIRRQLYVPIADAAQADDIAISARVVLQGRRLVFEPEAVAWEVAPGDAATEFARKVRVTNHSLRALAGLGMALWNRGFYSVELLSHKLLRHLAPFFLLGMLAASAMLAALPVFRLMLGLQAVFYAAAAAGFFLRRTRLGRVRLLSVPYYFCFVNAAALLGVLSVLRGTRLRAWTPRGGLPAHGGRV